jgi:hypothetical protein
MYLDFDLEDGKPIQPYKRHARCKTKDGAIKEAIRHLNESFATAGQIGIYTSYCGELLGYVIKYPGQEPYFEDDEDKCDLVHRFVHAYA